jgi:protein-L-isoaspartate(D-aspartate) O-methyltransferase
MAPLFRKGMKRMLADIDREVHATRDLIGKDALDPRVMAAMAKVPRAAFVPEHMKKEAFDNGALPIGYGQTISQPYIVALMTDLLAPEPEDNLLEIGTGSGYQSAVLSLLCHSVYSVEVIPALVESTRRRLADLGYTNIHLRSGNGYQGWPEYAPYDGIIVTAAATHVPPALLEQLRPGARLVIPVGPTLWQQELLLITKDAQNEIHTKAILAVAFVPLVDRLPDNDVISQE